MKRFGQRLWNLATLPVRLLIRVVLAPFRWVRARLHPIIVFFTAVPDDVSLTETLGDALESRENFFDVFAGLGEHIEALRHALLRSIIVLAITTALSFYRAEWLMGLLAQPLPHGLADLVAIMPTEGIGVYMRVSLLAGVALAMPWLVTELYLFIAPGLMPRSRVLLLLIIPLATVLFLVGMAFTYRIMLPPAVRFLLQFGSFRAAWRPSAYFSLVTNLMFWIGIFFQTPLVIYFLAAVGLVRASQLARQWRVAVVLIAIIAAAVTPTVDPVNMALVMVPLLVLYLISILGAVIAGAGRERSERQRSVGMKPSS